MNNEWISVKDGLPKGNYACLYFVVSSNIRSSFLAWFYPDIKKWQGINGQSIADITHWMPLHMPEPPNM